MHPCRFVVLILLLAFAVPALGLDLRPEDRKTLILRLAVDVSARRELSRWRATLYAYNTSGLEGPITLQRMDRLVHRPRRLGESFAARIERDGGYVFIDHPGSHRGMKSLFDAFLGERKMPVRAEMAGKVTREFRHGVEPGRFHFWLRFDAVQASLEEKIRPDERRETTRLRESDVGPFWLKLSRELPGTAPETLVFQIDWAANTPLPVLSLAPTPARRR